MARTKKGQALVLVTLALFAMCGLIGLAVDLGWSYYIEKTSRAAVDSAALAAVLEVYKIGGLTGPYDPGLTRTNDRGGTVTIDANRLTPAACNASGSPGTNLTNGDIACLYAARNGFSNSNARQNVRAAWGNTSPAPEVPDVDPVHYWTTVYAAQSVPQLFSAILGNTEGLVASKATAAIIDSDTTGSLYLLNRENDCLPLKGGGGNPDCGLDFLVQANANCPGGQKACGNFDPFSVRVGGGVIVASSADGVDYPQDDIAMVALGGADVQAQYYTIRDTGTYYEGNNANFGPNKPVNGGSGPQFNDPTSGPPSLPNPPLQDTAGGGIDVHPYPAGTIAGGTDANNPTPLFPGIYAATITQAGTTKLSGDPIQLSGGYYKFVDKPGDPPGFGHYTFIGGLHIASNANVVLNAGQYVPLGAKPQGSNPGQVLQISSGAVVTDNLTPNQAVPADNAGQLWVLAGPNYVPANSADVSVDEIVLYTATQIGATSGPTTAAALGLARGSTDIQLGNNQNAEVNLHGLRPVQVNPSAVDSKLDLEPYRRYVMWQDKDNSIIDYDNAGTIITDQANRCPSCTDDPLNWPKLNAGVNPASTELSVQAAPGTHIYGVVYQPRGAFTTMQGGGGYSGPLQIVTGAFHVQGNATLDLGVLDYPLTTRIVALIQ